MLRLLILFYFQNESEKLGPHNNEQIVPMTIFTMLVMPLCP